MAHFIGHPRLREVVKELSQREVLTESVLAAYLRDKGFSIADDTKVTTNNATDDPGALFGVCITVGDHAYCAEFHLPVTISYA